MNPTPSSPGIAARLAILRTAYQAKLPGKLDELRRAVAHARTGPPERLREAHRLAHSLYGSAGSFGFPEIAELARRIEDALAAGQLPCPEIEECLATATTLIGQLGAAEQAGP